MSATLPSLPLSQACVRHREAMSAQQVALAITAAAAAAAALCDCDIVTGAADAVTAVPHSVSSHEHDALTTPPAAVEAADTAVVPSLPTPAAIAEAVAVISQALLTYTHPTHSSHSAEALHTLLYSLINTADSQGKTPLIHAVQHNQHELARVLTLYGADRTIADKQGQTAGHYIADDRMRELLSVDKVGD